MNIKDNRSEIDSEKIYNLKELLDNLTIDNGLTLEKLKVIFKDYQIIQYQTVEEYLAECKDETFEYKHNKKTNINEVIQNRKVDYDFFKKCLSILSNKGLKYIEILEYISNLPNDIARVKEQEELIELLGIFHYGSIVKGSDIKRILRKLNNTTMKFFEYYEIINDLSTYNNQSIDKFEVIINQEELYPAKTLVFDNEQIFDNTSFSLRETGYYRRKEKKLAKNNK